MEKLNIEDHRRERLKELIDFYGTQDVVADMLDTSSGYLSQILRGRRPFSEKTARKFEDKIGYPENWFDVDEGGGYINVAQEEENSKYITIKQYTDVRGAMGKGAYLLDTEGEVIDWRVTPDWARTKLPANTGIENLKIITGLGDSMKGLYNSGDPLIVDTGINAIDFDAVYFFRVDDEGYVKRLQKTPSGIIVISKNTDYRDWLITKDMDLEIFGRVLKVWEGKDL